VSLDYTHTCDAEGPRKEMSPKFIRRLKCNRVSGHPPDLHQERDPRSFKVLGEWPAQAKK
jgi:hypothetical protein